ncbi:MAG: ATP-binding cassette domain-containing protein [Alphaproteobacteria bacterium]|nr:ATP-binding cassette domain-containing protein [Alphaproteobacteria bacterium]MBU1525188.1 ATP-binding cassette domain-containing protein [Alphaproteobacteria bacterium]MBU2352184.1 ATP-binding cassette domain-containing protein [Alphaproteobacteria bacterium]MBU2381194.1 ATP-binding cassette domain-containing protein [Alphaproteobacteria bacterium]
MSASHLAVEDPRRARAWLKAQGRPAQASLGRAAALTVLDAAPAVGFAAGLAWAISAFDDGLLAMIPGLGVALISLGARGLLAGQALLAGGRAAAEVKASVRSRALASLFAGRAVPLSTAMEGVEALDGHYARFEPARVSASVTPLLLIAVAALASPVAAGILLFTLIPFVLGMALAGTAAAGESRRQFAALSRLSGLFVDRVRALPAVLAFQAEDRVTHDVATASEDLQRRTARVLRVAFTSSAVLEFFSALSVALVAVYCGFNLLRLLPFPVPETLDLGRAFFVLALAPEVYAPLRRLAAAYHDRQAAEATQHTLEDAVPAVCPSPAATVAALPRTPPAIRFDGVTIRYGSAPPAVLRFDLDVRPGQTVVLTGASGAGKSSLLHALLGIAPVTEGRILIDGRPMAELGCLAGSVAWASQAPVIVPGTLGENIAVADRSACRRRLMAAAAAAGLKGDLDRRLDERGGGLSGGETRRLALARALLKDAPVLLLDEPTADLDRDAERALIEVIRRAAAGRTTLIATHSAAVTALADRVVRL